MPAGLFDDSTYAKIYIDSLRIVAVMPNPVGNDDYQEYFIVKNFSTRPLPLFYACYIKDDENTRWDFEVDTTLWRQCDSFKLISNKVAQLNNQGDKITLFWSENYPLQTITYTNAKEGVEIRFDK